MPITKSACEARESILKVLCNEVTAVTPENPDAFWSAAAREGVLALLWHRLEATATNEDRQRIAPQLRRQAARFMQCRQVTREALAAAHHRNIPVICLRGQALAEGLYTPSSLRPQSDVDILVAPPDMERLSGALREGRFLPVPSCPMLFRRGQMLLDAHVDPIGIARIAARAHMTSLRAEDFFQHATAGAICGQPVLVPTSRVMLPYLCLHALKHSFNRLIWLWDIALLARQITRENGWEAVAEGIAAYRLQRPCFYALSYVRQHMAAPVPDTVLTATHPPMGRRERSLYARFMAHDIPPYLAERTFARMIPQMDRRLDFWRETIFPAGGVRRQFAGTTDCPNCNFIRDRLRRLLGLAALIWREALALLRYG